MKTTQIEAIKNIIAIEEKNYNFNDLIINYVDMEALKECESSEDIRELLEKANEEYELTNEEIIYFASAMDYLRENDPSLRESMEIADEFWYETKNLNSELLASLLASRNNEKDYQDFITNVIEELDQKEVF